MVADTAADFEQVSARLRARGADVPRHIAAVADSGRRLANDFAKAVSGGNGVKASERANVDRLNVAYRDYLIVRRKVAGAVNRDAAFHRLEAAVAELQQAVSSYGATHYAEAQAGLSALRRNSRARTRVLIAAVVIALLCLVAVSVVLSGFARRVREYVAFTARVAGGDLEARVVPHGGDELAALAGGLNGMAEKLREAAEDRARREGQEHDYRESQREFVDRLQVSGSVAEAHVLLKAHLERSVPAGGVVVLNRNNSNDRLEPSTSIPDGWTLAERLTTATPRSCLTVRLAQTHAERVSRPPLVACEVCGALAPNTTCTPLLVGGEVIGSVLVGHPDPLDPVSDRCVAETVSQSAPVLANLRNLALDEARPATDALTGLSNRRAFHDTLLRMLAHAGRTLSPLSVIALDLDHFKAINDTYGHSHGDAVLAAVGDVLSDSIRVSDLAGRTGGEEFVVLLPDTTSEGAIDVAEKLRHQIMRQ